MLTEFYPALHLFVDKLGSDGMNGVAFACFRKGVGLVVALHALPGTWFRYREASSAEQRQLQRLVSIGLTALPVLSLVGHAAAVLLHAA